MIPRNVRVSEAPSHGKPVLLYDLKCAGSQAYLRLASESFSASEFSLPREPILICLA
jgi:cellulose biosynthesis protein BcsQ